MPVPSPIDQTGDPAPDTAAPSTLAGLMAPGRVDTIGSAFRIPIRPNVPFFLAHHPSEWDPEEIKGTIGGVAFDGVFWLPGLSRRTLFPGAALIRTRGKDEPVEKTYEHARDVSQREGWVWLDPSRHIPTECLPKGVAPGGYWREIPCIDPTTRETGIYHLEVWDLPTETLPGRRQRFAFERPGYNLFRAWLLLTGAVRPPLDYVIRAKAVQMRDRVDRARTLPIPDNALARKVAEAEGRASLYDEAVVPSKDAKARK